MAAILDFRLNNFSYFYIYKSSQSFLPIFKSTGPLVHENKRKKRVSRWSPWWPSWISDPNNLSYFRTTSHPNASYQASSQMAFQFRRRSKKIDFQDGCHGGHLGFLIGMILAIFDLQDTLMLPTKFGVNWPFGSGEEAKNRFSRWRPWRPSWNSDWNDFSYFWSTSHPDASYQVSSQLAFGVRIRSQK